MRSNDVCTQHSDTFDVTPGAKKTRLALNGCVTESDRLLAVQARALEERKAATQQCRLCRSALRAAGRTVVKVGRLVNLPDTVMDTLRIPGSMSDAGLQAHMQGLYDRVLPYKDAFEAVGLPSDGLTSLTNGVRALAAARSAHAATIQDAASAADAIRETQARASTIILALESIARRATLADREVVTKLNVARRVGPADGSVRRVRRRHRPVVNRSTVNDSRDSRDSWAA
ncbi:MAG TPA: hypothetical protein VGY57_11705 [Vicinamibacterales bacterium]|nr:hypothetical protein [Vicinamibacterales bacterium]